VKEDTVYRIGVEPGLARGADEEGGPALHRRRQVWSGWRAWASGVVIVRAWLGYRAKCRVLRLL